MHLQQTVIWFISEMHWSCARLTQAQVSVLHSYRCHSLFVEMQLVSMFVDLFFDCVLCRYVCRLRDILGGRFHGPWAAAASRRGGSIGSWPSFLGISVGCATIARFPIMGVPVLLHAAANRLGLAVLHHGRIYYGRDRWMAAIVATPQGDFHCHCLSAQLFSWLNMYHAGAIFS